MNLINTAHSSAPADLQLSDFTLSSLRSEIDRRVEALRNDEEATRGLLRHICKNIEDHELILRRVDKLIKFKNKSVSDDEEDQSPNFKKIERQKPLIRAALEDGYTKLDEIIDYCEGSSEPMNDRRIFVEAALAGMRDVEETSHAVFRLCPTA